MGPVLTWSLMVISCSIWSTWSFMGALVSRPGTTMEVGSVDGLHLGGLGSMGVVIGQRASSEARLPTIVGEGLVIVTDR